MPTPPPEGPPAGGYGGRASSAGEAEFGPDPSPPEATSGAGRADGDVDLSNFTLSGEVRDGRLVLSPSIEESDPEE